MNLTKQTEERLRRLKQHTGIAPNVSARIAFLKSYENGFYFRNAEIKLDGSLALDKVTWLGDTGPFIELLLNDKYPDLNERELAAAWAAHVEDGTATIGNVREVSEFGRVVFSNCSTYCQDS